MSTFVFASDSFKGTLSSNETAELLTEAARRHFPDCECRAVPVADGGEGTVDAVIEATGGRFVKVEVAGPLGAPVMASYGITPQGEAVIEMAAAAGLPLLKAEERDPLATSTYGVGQLVLHALDQGARSVTLAIGGSATNDGGTGMLRALGARFLDEHGAPLAGRGADLGRVAAVDLSGLDARVAQTEFVVMCDVDNPLLGEHGCAAVFAPQKGASAEDVALLEEGMACYSAVVAQALGVDHALTPGAGAAGGLGFACVALLGARLVSGVDRVLDLVGLDKHLEGADLVVTGEGHLDAQTERGKVVSGVAARARAHGVSVVAIAGGIAEGVDPAALGLAAAISCVPDVAPLDEVLAHACENYRRAADALFSTLALGASLG